MTEKQYDVVVIGGSAAGLTAAITVHRHYPDKSILLVRKEQKVMIPCGIPYIMGTVGSADNNLIPDAPLTANNVDLIMDCVIKIDREAKQITLAEGPSIGYGKLIVATGSQPIIPGVPGVEKPNVYAIYKDFVQLGELQEALNGIKNLVIIGGGFIGVEFADECKKSGIENVTIVEMLDHCLQLTFDKPYCMAAEKIIRERGVNVRTTAKVVKLDGADKVEKVVLDNGEELPADAVLLGIGARASVELARDCGLNIGPTGGIQVDRFQRSSDPNVFAAGDCAEKISFFGGRPSGLKLASIASAEARIAGANLFGVRRENIGTIGVWSTAIGETALAGAGLTESMATNMGYDYVVGEAEAPNRHPGCMPGMSAIKAKLLFERRTGVLIGAQLMGALSVGELINALSACIQQRMTFDDIAIFQIGTHPALTASPVAYQLVNAAEMAMMKAQG
ncbi:MAG: FAD-dependent oxidoreductase [Candidatus Alcyoniella australis]|nr:FAD-dependent oxidoreductase [Candidatus Alcyoniella australis]